MKKHLTEKEEWTIRKVLDTFYLEEKPRGIFYKGKSMIETPVYRNPDGNCCALGLMMDWENMPAQFMGNFSDPGNSINWVPGDKLRREGVPFLPEYRDLPDGCLSLAQAIHDVILDGQKICTEVDSLKPTAGKHAWTYFFPESENLLEVSMRKRDIANEKVKEMEAIFVEYREKKRARSQE